MSRPIYEPTPPRTDAELGYGSRQLFRRPAPSIPPFGDEGEYAYREGGTIGVAQSTWQRLELGSGAKTGADGDPFTLVTDGIQMAGGRYVVAAQVWWDGFAETGMIALGSAAGEDVYFRTALTPTLHTISGSWNFIPVNGFRYTTVYLWVYQNSSAAANALGKLVVLEIL